MDENIPQSNYQNSPSLNELEAKPMDISHIKCEINNLIWMYGDDSMTLREADRRACIMLEIFEGKIQ